MPRKPKNTSLATTRKPNSDIQKSGRAGNGGLNAKTSATRAAFLKAYEDNFGNVTIACKIAGIHRQTFYRWMSSPTRTNARFRKRLELTRPEEKHIDFMESAFNAQVGMGSESLIKFGLTTKGRKRGWSEKPDVIVINTEVLDRVAQAYQAFLSDHPELTFEDKWKWLVRFANGAKEPVEPKELAKRVGLDQAQQGAGE